jgi:hypothetical protein
VPVETLVSDDRKVGYFKVPSPKQRRMSPGVAAATTAVVLSLVLRVASRVTIAYTPSVRKTRFV